ncbi:HAMP domain-containing sensor histidine kinase [Desulfovibrio subterraneus]|uniref:histidine kinase n=1 Tax=Desulfovibrio subterraneus TaxID=2718620 RepID=A0A7J0BP67_9BACT|nr:ATP-binding protein [Desulfovibrio subterraneus]GFM35071.1 hypothetical protein DSM101010T_34360 [Desulfovibrio subterraneus]
MRTWLLRIVTAVLVAIGILSLSLFFCTRVLERGPMATRMRQNTMRELILAGNLLLNHSRTPHDLRAQLPSAITNGAAYMLFDRNMHLVYATDNDPELVMLAEEAYRTGELTGDMPLLHHSAGEREGRLDNAMPFTADDGELYFIAESLSRHNAISEVYTVSWTGFRILALVLAAGLVFLLLRFTEHPAREMRKALRRFARGEYDARVNMDKRFKGDELAKLAYEFNSMAEHMGRLHAEQQRLFGEISHEMRSPLSRMSLAVELAGRSVPPETARLITRIRRDADRLGTLSNEMLELARCQRPAHREEQVSLTDLVRQVAADSRFEAEASGKRVECGPLPEHVEITGNRETLYRMLENVIRNGVRHTPQDTAVSVNMAFAEHAGRDEAIIRIADKGSGVPQEELQSIFRPFVRGSSSHGLEGKGLGLAITRHVAMRHGGSVIGENNPEGGFVVSIRLPVTKRRNEETAVRRLAVQFS